MKFIAKFIHTTALALYGLYFFKTQPICYIYKGSGTQYVNLFGDEVIPFLKQNNTVSMEIDCDPSKLTIFINDIKIGKIINIQSCQSYHPNIWFIDV